MSKRVRMCVAIAVAVILAAACATLPEPSGSDDTLLVIHYRVTGPTASDDYDDYFVVTVSKAGFTKRYRLSNAGRILIVHGAPVGSSVLSVKHYLSDGSQEGPTKRVVSSAVKPGGITINSNELIVVRDHGRLEFHWDRMSPEQGRLVNDRLEKMENYALWDGLERWVSEDSSSGPGGPKPTSGVPAGNTGTLVVPVLIAEAESVPLGYRIEIALHSFLLGPKEYAGHINDHLVVFSDLGTGRYTLVAQIVETRSGDVEGEPIRTIATGVSNRATVVNDKAVLLRVREGKPAAEWVSLSESDIGTLRGQFTAASMGRSLSSVALPEPIVRSLATPSPSRDPEGETPAFTGSALGVVVRLSPRVDPPVGMRVRLSLPALPVEPRSYGAEPRSQVVVFNRLSPGTHQLHAELVAAGGDAIGGVSRTSVSVISSQRLSLCAEELLISEEDGAFRLSWQPLPDSTIAHVRDRIASHGGAKTVSVAIPDSTHPVPSRDSAASTGERLGGPRERESFDPNIPAGEPDVTYRDGKRYWGELHNGIVPHGTGVLVFGDGTVYEGSFERGGFEGHGTLTYPNGTVFVGLFEGGVPTGDGELTVDADRLVETSEDARSLLEELKQAKRSLSAAAAAEAGTAELQTMLTRIKQIESSIRDLVDIRALLTRIGIDSDMSMSLHDGFEPTLQLESRRETRNVAGVYEEVSETKIDVRLADGAVTAARTESAKTTAMDGEAVQVESKTTEATASPEFIGIEHREELRERRYEPETSLAFGTWGLDYTGSFFAGFSSHNVLGSIGYRSVSRKTPFPGPAGGSKPGFDFRLNAGAGVAFSDSDPVFSVSGWASLGYSKVTFEPLDRNDLTQPGKGFSIGVQAGGTLIPDYEVIAPMIAPLLTFDRYTYNPSTAKYRATHYRFFIWPYPFVLYLGLGGSI